ncbi:RNA polymerase sigma-54 factor [Rhodothalassium salexigens]|uniref:RNA polymerase factor sigma-54 n=1 Tax=Rhodothalassium salexigens TaxID=1086 RepID=UPI0019142332|nr:RNA polymerase factor sigma-54 [Rhodothalassium salexigens]MBK5919445.1 RNA polymerase sigma-54 factor [Rhodothalassium salexigens]
MALGPRLDLRQSQQLVLTPQLQQAIKLLQYSNLELGEFVAQEAEKNPLLDLGGGDDAGAAEPGADPTGGPANGAGDPAPGADAEPPATSADQGLADGAREANDAPLDADYEDNVFNHDAPADRADGGVGLGVSAPGAGGGDELPDLQQTLTRPPSLQEHLAEQMPIAVTDPAERVIAAHLIDLVDEAGYLRVDLDEVADRLGCAPAAVEAVLARLQTLDPVGVFARDLPECLRLQLVERNRFDPCMAALLDRLDLVAHNDRAGLKRACGVDDEDLAEMIQELRALDPKPGLAFGEAPADPVVPDVFVRRAPGGRWLVELNTDTLPRVLVNQSYYAELSTRAGAKEDKAFLSECLSNANWLVRALDQRQRTILKVVSELVRTQEGFFRHGVRHLKPLTLRDVAEAIDMHESTVSRVTSNKYVATDRGVFELKYFFTAAIRGAGGGDDSHSAEAVRDRIRELVDKEDPKKILSDDKIVAILRGEGIDIARRTVAKYREAMRIGSSVERRRQKRMRLSS